MKIQRLEQTIIGRLSGIILTLLLLSGMALAVNLVASATMPPRAATFLHAERAAQQPSTQLAATMTGSYSGDVTLTYAATGVFSDTLTAPGAAADGNALPYLGTIDLQFQLEQVENRVSGYLLLDKTHVFPAMHNVALMPGADPVAVGPRVSGTLVGTTLQLVSEPFTTVVSAQSVTRQFRLIADAVPLDGMKLSGEYRETIWDFGPGASTIIGDFSLARPAYGLLTTVPEGNSLPVAVDDFAETTMGTPISVNVISNDIDPDGDLISITAIAAPAQGTTTTDGTTIVYTPNANFVGTDRFNYTIADSQGGSATATLSIAVKAAATNQPPTAGADTATTTAGLAVTINVLANDSDPDGDPLTVTILQQPQNGSAVVNGVTIVYTPNAGFSGTDSFTYTVTDSKGATANATITVTVQPQAEGVMIYLPIVNK